MFVGLDAFPSLVPGGKQLPGRGSANGEKVAQSGSTASLLDGTVRYHRRSLLRVQHPGIAQKGKFRVEREI